jgi:hypothetical protein
MKFLNDYNFFLSLGNLGACNIPLDKSWKHLFNGVLQAPIFLILDSQKKKRNICSRFGIVFYYWCQGFEPLPVPPGSAHVCKQMIMDHWKACVYNFWRADRCQSSLLHTLCGVSMCVRLVELDMVICIMEAGGSSRGWIWQPTLLHSYSCSWPWDQCSNVKCAHAFQKNHTSLKLSNFFATLHNLNFFFDIGRFELKILWCLTILRKYMQWNDALKLFEFPT